MSPVISVIIPVYNVEPWLHECLDSICAQTFTDWECICVDDGSTDGSGSILNAYASKDLRFRIICQENQGSGPARNKALNNARGEFVCFIDPDDRYADKHALESLYTAMKESGCQIVCGNGCSMDEDGSNVTIDKGYAYSGKMDYRETQQQYHYQRYLFSREFIERNGIRFPNLWRRQDPPFLVECLLKANFFYAIADVVYCYRRRSSKRGVPWMANAAIRLKDNLTALELISSLAERNRLWNLYERNFACLTDCGAFSSVEHAFPVLPQLKGFVKHIQKSGRVSKRAVAKRAMAMFLNEKWSPKRLVVIALTFGGRALVEGLAINAYGRMASFFKTRGARYVSSKP